MLFYPPSTAIYSHVGKGIQAVTTLIAEKQAKAVLPSLGLVRLTA